MNPTEYSRLKAAGKVTLAPDKPGHVAVTTTKADMLGEETTETSIYPVDTLRAQRSGLINQMAQQAAGYEEQKKLLAGMDAMLEDVEAVARQALPDTLE